MTGRSLAYKVFQQYPGRTLTAVAAITVAVYFAGIPALTVACVVATCLAVVWWLYYLFYGPMRS